MVCRFKGLNLTVNPLLTFRKNSPLYDFILAARVSCKYSDSSIVHSVYNYFIYLIELKVCMSYNREFKIVSLSPKKEILLHCNVE